MVGELKGEIALTPLEETYTKRKTMDGSLLQLMKVLSA
jgi:hypothetical protein